jgi:nicotinate-nucleotide pyrophosphorylase (carboxylating)
MAIDSLPSLPELLYADLVRRALLEDLGRAGDITTDAIVPPGEKARARLVARKSGRIAGMEVARAVFRTEPDVGVAIAVQDGCDASAGETLARIEGPARALLTAERTALNFVGRMSGIATCTRDIVQKALNFVGRMSGIATCTREVVQKVAPWGTRVVCTRKTTPGLRVLEKYSVRAGGGANHRFGLDDAVLIKDNHRQIAGGIEQAVSRVRRHVGHMAKIEVEVDTLEELQEALRLGVDVVLLDNMSPGQLRQAVGMAKGRALTEASGGVTPENAAAIAAAGVDLISLGWITHSAPALDVALDL